MACKKSIIKNNSNTSIGVINYTRCSDYLNMNNHEVLENETINVWYVDGTYSTASKNIQIISTIDWPPPITQTPSITPSVTPSYGATPTPSVTSTVTPTTTVTPTVTSTVTPTRTQTPTPTRPVFTITSLSSGTTSLDACSSPSLQTYYSNVMIGSWTTGTTIYLDSNFTTPIFATYLSDSGGFPGNTIWQTDGSGNIILIDSCPAPTPSATRTPTPTPTPTITPTITPTNTVTPTVTETPTNTPTPTITETSTPTPTVTDTPTSTPTPTVTETPTNTPTPTISETPTNTPTNTLTPTPTPTSATTYDSTYQAVLDYANTQGYTLPSLSGQSLQNEIIVELKNNSIWNKLDLFYLFQTDGDNDFATLNWVDPSSYKITEVNSPTFTTNVGFMGNGTNAYLNTGWNATIGPNFIQTGATHGVYTSDAGRNRPATPSYITGSTGFHGGGGNPYNIINYFTGSSGQNGYYVNMSGASNYAPQNASFRAVSISGSTLQPYEVQFGIGFTVLTPTTGVTTLSATTDPIYIMARGVPSPQWFAPSNVEFRADFWGGYLSQVEVETIYDALDTYNSSV